MVQRAGEQLREQTAKARKWIDTNPLAFFIWLAVVAVIVLFIFLGYQASWAGFGEQEIREATTKTVYSGTTKVVTEFRIEPTKTLWDWLALLIAPIVLAGAAALFNWIARQSEKRIKDDLEGVKLTIESQREIAEMSRDTDLRVAQERQYQTTFDTYIDRVSKLILDNGLGTGSESERVRSIARTRTLTALRSLDAKRVEAVFRFIDNARLRNVISLSSGNLTRVSWDGADLRRTNLQKANLRRASLRETNMRRVWLNGAVHRRANLQDADLRGADLSGANLKEADLRGANLGQTDLTSNDLPGFESSEIKNLPDAVVKVAYMRLKQPQEVELREADSMRKIIQEEAESGKSYVCAADLRGSDLRGADLSGARLTQATYSGETKWTDGFDPEAAGAILVD